MRMVENQRKGGMHWSFNGLLLLYTPFMQVQIFGNVHIAWKTLPKFLQKHSPIFDMTKRRNELSTLNFCYFGLFCKAFKYLTKLCTNSVGASFTKLLITLHIKSWGVLTTSFNDPISWFLDCINLRYILLLPKRERLLFPGL